MKIKTIDINAKEWFDKVNGNSYFSGSIVINFGMKSEKTMSMPFQYGYGDFYLQRALELLKEQSLATPEKMQKLWRYCKNNNILLRTFKQEKCLKRDLS